MTAAPRQRTTMWAIALIVAVTALGTQLTAQLGRSGCLRHPDTLAAAATTAPAPPQLGDVHAGDTPHAACALCSAPAPSSCAAVGALAPSAPIVVATTAPGLGPVATAPVEPPPLDYAPKTSPPIA